MKTTVILAVAIGCIPLAGSAAAATPPDRIHYQGVLRNASGAPLNGDHDMVFRLWDGPVAGNEILLDRHLAVNLQSVRVTGGLFDAEIGAGQVQDGAGPGLYTEVAEVFRAFGDVWLEIQVVAEVLSPRIQVSSVPYALNAHHLDGKSPAHFIDTSPAPQNKLGKLVVGGTTGSSSAWAVEAWGTYGGGLFVDLDGSGAAYLGWGDYGVSGFGNTSGGFFRDQNGTGYAYVGHGESGVTASGNTSGGYFQDANNSGYAFVGDGDNGVTGYGSWAGGEFHDTDGTGFAYVGNGDYGIQAFASGVGGYFADNTNSGHAYVGYGDRGIWARGTFAGGTFSHPNAVTHWADVSTPTRKIQGTGTVSFVQNHPYDKDKVVVYAAPEGDEVAVYTRGSARLVDGKAQVRLGETFALVANPDIGLTAHLTPRSRAELYVENVSTSELVVRALEGSDPDAAFDYLVYGLRIGFENLAPLQVKSREAFLPVTADVEGSYATHPELRRYSAMERFKEMRTALGETAELDFSRSRAMAAAIDANRDGILATALAESDAERASLARKPEERIEETSHPAPRPEPRTVPAAPEHPDVVREAAPASIIEGLLSTVTVWEDVRPGDVLAIDPTQPGVLRRATTRLDPGVAGCVAETPEGTDLATGQALVATSGVVLCLADASLGPIAAGDLLTTSSNPGHAARADEAPQGAILGKAMEALPGGSGRIRVLMR